MTGYPYVRISVALVALILSIITLRSSELASASHPTGTQTDETLTGGVGHLIRCLGNGLTPTICEGTSASTGFTGDTQEQISQIIFSTCSIDFDAVAANKVKTAFCPVTGAKIGDHVIVTNQDLTLGLVTQSATVNGTELVRIAVTNPSLSSVNPPSATWALIIFR